MKIAGNEVTPALAAWLSQRVEYHRGKRESRSWHMHVPAPSPVVLDFLPSEGLRTLKRFNGHFVMATEPPHERPPVSVSRGEPEKSPPVGGKPATDPAPKTRSESLIVQIRTRNGNLFEVYPTRQATSAWQRYFEPQENLSLSPFCRASPPSRFGEDTPVSLVLALYPRQLPAIYEFRNLRLVRLESAAEAQPAGHAEARYRHGRGTLVLYNFSERPVKGTLVMPASMMAPAGTTLSLDAGERREVPVAVRISAEGYRAAKAEVSFVADDQSVPPARLATQFYPALESFRSMAIAGLLPTDVTNADRNGEAICRRKLAGEEPALRRQIPGSSGLGVYAQEGASVATIADGIRVTIAERPDEDRGRVTVEIPWPDGLRWERKTFLELEFRLATQPE
jgi:hypothetical protein